MKLPSASGLLNASIPLDGLTVSRGLPYGAHPRQRMDVYRQPGGKGRPVVVWFYGGSWQTGQRQEYRFVAAALARAGCVVAVPDYRLHPEVSYPAFVEDGALAVQYAHAHAAGWGGDPARVFTMGHSAGAYIAVMLALAGGFGVQGLLAGAVGLAGPYDFLPIRDKDIQAVFASAAGLRDTQPINHVDGHAPPLLLLHGAPDLVVLARNSRRLAARITAKGGQVTLKTYPLAAHIGLVLGFVPWLAWRAPVMEAIMPFLHRHVAARQAQAIHAQA